MIFDHYCRRKKVYFVHRDYNHKNENVVVCDLVQDEAIKEKSNVINELILFPLGIKKRKKNDIVMTFEDKEVQQFWEGRNDS